MEFSLALGSVINQVVVFSKLNTPISFHGVGCFCFLGFFGSFVFKFLPNQHLYSEIKPVLSEAIEVNSFIQHAFMKNIAYM